mgnify:CR=1 FL=1
MLGWLDTIIQGVLLGGLYAIYATGLSLIFGIMRLINLAHGDLIVGAAFLILSLGLYAGIDPVLALAIALPVMFAFGYALQALLLNRTLGDDILPPLLVTFGISVIIQNALLLGFGAYTHRLQQGAIETQSLVLPGDIAIGVYPVIIFAVAVLSIAGLQLLFFKTKIGRAFRAAPDTGRASLRDVSSRLVYRERIAGVSASATAWVARVPSPMTVVASRAASTMVRNAVLGRITRSSD